MIADVIIGLNMAGRGPAKEGEPEEIRIRTSNFNLVIQPAGRIVPVPTPMREEKVYSRKILDRFPAGTIESLFPVVPAALNRIPGIVSDDPGWQVSLAESKFTPEQALKQIKARGLSIEDTAVEILKRLKNAGVKLDTYGNTLQHLLGLELRKIQDPRASALRRR